MSGIVHYKGKLTEVKPSGNETLQEIAKRILEERKEIDRVNNNDYLEYLIDSLVVDYVAVDGRLYKYELKGGEHLDDIFHASEEEDGTISFEVKYHNGGRSFGNAIKEALNRNKITP